MIKVVKSPVIEEALALEASGRANQLRDLWMRLGNIEDRKQLEELWPAMRGRWFGEFGSSSSLTKRETQMNKKREVIGYV